MKKSRRTQLLILAALTLLIAVASTGWWLNSPQGVRRTGEALVILLGSGCLSQFRRLPSRSPAVLGTTLIGLAVAVLAFWE